MWRFDKKIPAEMVLLRRVRLETSLLADELEGLFSQFSNVSAHRAALLKVTSRFASGDARAICAPTPL